jgi:flagellar hook protein FlgE
MGAIAVNITGQGGSQRTDNPFDLMINGDSFFVVNKGGTNYFTKAGNFNVDEAGTLVNSAGYPVMGWQGKQMCPAIAFWQGQWMHPAMGFL